MKVPPELLATSAIQGKPTLLTAGNSHAIIAAFLAGARLTDVGFDIEEGPGSVVVWLQRNPPAELIRASLEGYLQPMAHAGVTLHVYPRAPE